MPGKSAKRRRPVPFVKGFRPRTAEQLKAAVGDFPWDSDERKANRAASLQKELHGRTALTSLDQLDNFCYYANVDLKGKPVWENLPEPADDGCWLANYAESGQTFNEYTTLISLRSGKFNSFSHAGHSVIYLLPITALADDKIQGWPSNGPDLMLLAEWVRAFYDREVIILDPVSLSVMPTGMVLPGRKKPFKPKYEGERPIGFRSATYESYIEGRVSEDGARYQTHIDGLLSEITEIRTSSTHTYTLSSQAKSLASRVPPAGSADVVDLTGDSPAKTGTAANISKAIPSATDANEVRTMSDAFAVIGVTMEDLYSSEGDLFIAGMAAGVSKAAVLSFARYHPRIRMHFQNWYDYGYVAQSAEYSYFEEGKPRPKNVSTHAPEVLDKESQANYLRRAGKLVVHELGHVYGIDHCVHYHCVMNGTGHLVEDFSAPAHLCGVCLRKVQFRMGFEVVTRYERLKDVFQSGGLQKEARWVERRLEHLRDR